MITPLVNHRNFEGITKYSNDILLGRVIEITDLDLYIKRYLLQIATITFSLPDQHHPISLEEYITEVIQLRESTSSRPSDFTPLMEKQRS